MICKFGNGKLLTILVDILFNTTHSSEHFFIFFNHFLIRIRVLMTNTKIIIKYINYIVIVNKLFFEN